MLLVVGFLGLRYGFGLDLPMLGFGLGLFSVFAWVGWYLWLSLVLLTFGLCLVKRVRCCLL